MLFASGFLSVVLDLAPRDFPPPTPHVTGTGAAARGGLAPGRPDGGGVGAPWLGGCSIRVNGGSSKGAQLGMGSDL